MDDRRRTRRVLLIGGGAFLLLTVAGAINILNLPVAALALMSSVIAAGIILRRWVVLGISIVTSAGFLGAAIMSWIAWGEAFDDADANLAVPADIHLTGGASAIVALCSDIVLLAVWVLLLVARRRPAEATY